MKINISKKRKLGKVISTLTTAQRQLYNELRDNKKLYIRDSDSTYSLYERDKGRVRVLNKVTVDKLLSHQLLVYPDPDSSIITLGRRA